MHDSWLTVTVYFHRQCTANCARLPQSRWTSRTIKNPRMPVAVRVSKTGKTVNWRREAVELRHASHVIYSIVKILFFRYRQKYRQMFFLVFAVGVFKYPYRTVSPVAATLPSWRKSFQRVAYSIASITSGQKTDICASSV